MRKINITLISVFFLFLFTVIYSFTVIMKQKIVFISVAFLLYLVLMVNEYLRYKKENAFIIKLIQSLDNADDGNFEMFETMDETIESKLQYKIQRIYSLFDTIQEKADINRNELQQLITDISHQVKTPISNLRIYNDLLKRQELSENEKKKFIENSELQLDRLDFLMKSMIKISRLENGIICLEPQKNLIYNSILTAVKDVYIEASHKNIMIEIFGDKTLNASFDLKWTSEAISNILDNCIKYSCINTNINIKIDSNDFYAKIIICDQGKGIEEQHYAEIFKRFYREPSARNEKGIGVGLYLCREILLKEKGYITVQSKVGKGSVFTVFLPLLLK
ncbi:MAG: HAMP domain-containing sensor histidine kinase [Longicatena sp.]